MHSIGLSPASSVAPPDAVVLVLGDSGVGKSALVALIASDVVREHSQLLGRSAHFPEPTIGAEPHVLFHTPRMTPISSAPYSSPSIFPVSFSESAKNVSTDTSRNQERVIELLDVGGRAAHADARSLFYQPGHVHGLILVHDLSNKRSLANLRRWLTEVSSGLAQSRGSSGGGASDVIPVGVGVAGGTSLGQYTLHNFDGEFTVPQTHSIPSQPPCELEVGELRIPILLVGTRSDFAPPSQALPASVQSTESSSGTSGAPTIHVNLRDPLSLERESAERIKLDLFLDTVLERALGTLAGGPSQRRPAVSGTDAHTTAPSTRIVERGVRPLVQRADVDLTRKLD